MTFPTWSTLRGSLGYSAAVDGWLGVVKSLVVHRLAHGFIARLSRRATDANFRRMNVRCAIGNKTASSGQVQSTSPGPGLLGEVSGSWTIFYETLERVKTVCPERDRIASPRTDLLGRRWGDNDFRDNVRTAYWQSAVTKAGFIRGGGIITLKMSEMSDECPLCERPEYELAASRGSAFLSRRGQMERSDERWMIYRLMADRRRTRQLRRWCGRRDDAADARRTNAQMSSESNTQSPRRDRHRCCPCVPLRYCTASAVEPKNMDSCAAIYILGWSHSVRLTPRGA